jgi:hypothetical protein
VIFSGMTINVTQGMIGTATITAETIGNENALELDYSAGNGTATDFRWEYTVTAAPGFILTDAASSLTGVAGTLGESLLGNGNPSPGGTLVGSISLGPVLPASEIISIVPPQFSLLAVKDQATGATGEASALINGFSVSAVPGPIVGAGLPGLVTACGALIGLARRRRQRTA